MSFSNLLNKVYILHMFSGNEQDKLLFDVISITGHTVKKNIVQILGLSFQRNEVNL